MENGLTKENLLDLQKRLKLFFPEEYYTSDTLQDAVQKGDVIYQPEQILPFLQSALLDEKIIEVELDGLTRVYFSRLYDDFPPLEESEMEGEEVLDEPDYTPAEYLKDMDYMNSLPLEPALGNMIVRKSHKVLLRIFTSSYAVELGSTFQRTAEVRDVPVLRFNWPEIGRIVRGARSFRAKVPAAMSLTLVIIEREKPLPSVFEVADVSAKGMGFRLSKEQLQLVAEGETIRIEISLESDPLVSLEANVRHITKMRGKKGIEYICGLQFDLENRIIAGKVESIVATVQRAHLKELSELSEESGLNLIA